MNELELTGRARTHVVELEHPRCVLHVEAVTSFLAMRDAATAAGIDLVAVSSYRDFDRQFFLWKRKWRGERPLPDRSGRPVDVATLDDARKVDAILCWSAIPGGSRHHWGTDVDVIDAASMPAGYQVQLVPAEYAAEGIFGRLAAWLDANMSRFGFHRPYASAGCGAGSRALAPELLAGVVGKIVPRSIILGQIGLEVNTSLYQQARIFHGK